MTNCLVLFPPQWAPFSPHLAPVSIVSYLRNSGIKCDISDLNLDFYLRILRKDFLKKTLYEALDSIPLLKEEIQNIVLPDKTADEYSMQEQIKMKKLLYLNNIKNSLLEEFELVIDNVQSSIDLLNDREAFYYLPLASNAVMVLNRALDIVSLAEFPQELSLYSFKNKYVKMDWENTLQYCKSNKIFNDFYKTKIPDLINKNYDLIGISLSSTTQLFSALSLAMQIKLKINEAGLKTKICIGGNYVSRITDAFVKNSDFFKIFADYVIYEEGERPLYELIEYISGKKDLSSISSLIYLDENSNVKKNKKNEPTCLNKLAISNIDDFPLDKYLLPEIILPVQLSRGCYWKKCSFCDHYFGQEYNVKNIEILVNELKILQEKYNINNFEFTDDCISPSFLKSFSEKILQEKLKINWYCDLRLENSMTQDLLDLAYKAGLKMVLWGFEAGSKRIMKLINKGIDIDNRFEILKRANKAGIYNFAYTFTGFPTETYDEAMQTVDAVCNHTDIIHACGTGNFSLGKHSFINSHPEEYGITKLEDDEIFSSDQKYMQKNGLSNEELKSIENILIQKLLTENRNTAWMYLSYRELLFLYIVKYGRDKVLEMQYNNIIQ